MDMESSSLIVELLFATDLRLFSAFNEVRDANSWAGEIRWTALRKFCIEALRCLCDDLTVDVDSKLSFEPSINETKSLYITTVVLSTI